MFRVVLGIGVALSAGVAVAATAVANDARTTRIEPRGFYGATVSIEAGVRVFRPLPRTTHVIINPNKTPLNLTIEETRHVYEDSNYTRSGDNNARDRAAPHHGYGAVSGFPARLKRRGRRHGAVRRVGAPVGPASR
ncbi:MAG: hypothetical protein JXQ99_25655 [Hyphomicrobiaceae bacterium]